MMYRVLIILAMVTVFISGCGTSGSENSLSNQAIVEEFIQLNNDGNVDDAIRLLADDVTLQWNEEIMIEGKADLHDFLTYNAQKHTLLTNFSQFNVVGETVTFTCEWIDDFDKIVGMEAWTYDYEYRISDNKISSIVGTDDKEEVDRYYELTNGAIGIRWEGGNGENIVVVELPNNSPAKEAGVQVGDKIVAVDGVNYKQMVNDEVWFRIAGTVGSQVKLTVQREGVAEPFDVYVKRVDSTVIWPD